MLNSDFKSRLNLLVQVKDDTLAVLLLDRKLYSVGLIDDLTAIDGYTFW